MQGKFLPRTGILFIKPLVTCSVKVTNRRHSISNDGLAQFAHFDALTPATSLNEAGLHSCITCAFNARSLTRKDLSCDLPYTSPFRPSPMLLLQFNAKIPVGSLNTADISRSYRADVLGSPLRIF